MNWMGGARSRISYSLQGERKIQQEFFERKKLEAARSIANKTPSHRKKDLSQDLMALHTVSKIHSQFPTVSQRKSIKKLDLGTFQSCTRPIEEVDIGPCSPTPTPSKIALCNSSIKRNTDIKPSTDVKTEKFSKPYTATLPTGLSTCKVQTAQTEPSLKSKTSPSPQGFLENQQNHGRDMISAITPFSFSKHGAESYQKNRMKFDPFVSEDFQNTPLLSYTKKRSLDKLDSFNAKKQCSGENHGNAVESGQRSKTTVYSSHDHQRHRSHSHKHKYKSQDDYKHRPRKIQNVTDTNKLPDFETSTPMKNQKSEEFNKVSKFAALEGVSPIFGAKKVLQDHDEEGFQMKPRLMHITSNLNLTHRGDEGLTSQSSYSNERKTGQFKNQRLDKDFSSVSENNVEIFETPKNQNFIEYVTINRQDCHSNNSTFKTESLEDSSCEHKALINASQHDSGSSLGRYREDRHFGRKRDSPFIEKETVSSYKVAKSMHVIDTLEIIKPHFTDLEEDGFKYKPLNTSSLKSGSFSGLMNMYHTADKNRSLQNETPRPIGALRQDHRHEKSTFSDDSIQRVCSPVAVDEFPAHLTSPSRQLKDLIDNHLASIAKEERFTDKKFNSISQSESSVSYMAKQSKMDDVLNEIMNLKEDTAVSDKTDETSQINCPAVPPGGQTSESFEADVFIETDDYMMNAELEYMQSLEQNSKSDITKILPEEICKEDKTTDGAEKTLGIPSNVVDTEALVDAIVPDSDKSVETKRKQNNSRGLLENDKNLTNSFSIHPGNALDKQVLIGGKGEVKADRKYLASVDNKSMSLRTTMNRNISNVHAAVNQTRTPNNVKERNTEQTNTTGIKHTNKQNRTFGYNEDNKMKRTSTIQDPEVSSGHNKCTQTEIQTERICVDSSTSPLKDSSVGTNMCEIGIQCELNVFPTLSSLASGSLTAALKNNLYQDLIKKVVEYLLQRDCVSGE